MPIGNNRKIRIVRKATSTNKSEITQNKPVSELPEGKTRLYFNNHNSRFYSNYRAESFNLLKGDFSPSNIEKCMNIMLKRHANLNPFDKNSIIPGISSEAFEMFNETKVKFNLDIHSALIKEVFEDILKNEEDLVLKDKTLDLHFQQTDKNAQVKYMDMVLKSLQDKLSENSLSSFNKIKINKLDEHSVKIIEASISRIKTEISNNFDFMKDSYDLLKNDLYTAFDDRMIESILGRTSFGRYSKNDIKTMFDEVINMTFKTLQENRFNDFDSFLKKLDKAIFKSRSVELNPNAFLKKDGLLSIIKNHFNKHQNGISDILAKETSDIKSKIGDLESYDKYIAPFIEEAAEEYKSNIPTSNIEQYINTTHREMSKIDFSKASAETFLGLSNFADKLSELYAVLEGKDVTISTNFFNVKTDIFDNSFTFLYGWIMEQLIIARMEAENLLNNEDIKFIEPSEWMRLAHYIGCSNVYNFEKKNMLNKQIKSFERLATEIREDSSDSENAFLKSKRDFEVIKINTNNKNNQVIEVFSDEATRDTRGNIYYQKDGIVYKRSSKTKEEKVVEDEFIEKEHLSFSGSDILSILDKLNNTITEINQLEENSIKSMVNCYISGSESLELDLKNIILENDITLHNNEIFTEATEFFFPEGNKNSNLGNYTKKINKTISKIDSLILKSNNKNEKLNSYDRDLLKNYQIQSRISMLDYITIDHNGNISSVGEIKTVSNKTGDLQLPFNLSDEMLKEENLSILFDIERKGRNYEVFHPRKDNVEDLIEISDMLIEKQISKENSIESLKISSDKLHYVFNVINEVDGTSTLFIIPIEKYHELFLRGDFLHNVSFGKRNSYKFYYKIDFEYFSKVFQDYIQSPLVEVPKVGQNLK